ncbi:hypothetical protein [Variovorax sp. N23]|uniref:hypothetical protein n=1 Tax=Variovorax sp. N23 TaxID=2980555 RepID=UPI0021C7F6E2|nr:hypothetical protein [Variovorax sp. N23]MCU4120237.1 hypothetical protein [Variovorax sp. N23]
MEALVEIFLVLTGKMLVFLLSFGAWRSESMMGNESNVHAAAGALSFVRDGRRVVTVTGQQVAGMAFYGLLIAGFLLAVSLL